MAVESTDKRPREGQDMRLGAPVRDFCPGDRLDSGAVPVTPWWGISGSPVIHSRTTGLSPNL